MEFKSLSQIKTKGRLPNAKNKKRSDVKAELEKSSNYWDLSRFEYEIDHIFRTEVENCRVGRGKRANRSSGANRCRKINRANRDGQVSKTVRVKRVGIAGRIKRVKREKNRSVITNRTRVKEAEITWIN